ncbi:MAG: hypothetical protein M3R69_11065 [Acidobacteriota bacterium]|nr:hypothetical protein [Acidobacteriota bacterium]
MRTEIAQLLKLFGVLLVLCAACAISRAQTGSIEGSARATDGSIPPGVKVVLIDNENDLTREPVTIDAVTGKFEIKNVQEGRYLLVACAGTTYNPTRLSIEVKEGKIRQAGLTLLVARMRTLVKGVLANSPNIDVGALAYGCEVASMKTDARGHFKFESLPVPPKQYVVRVQPAGASALNSNAFQITPGGETEVAISFKGANSENTLVAEVVYPSRCDRTQGEQADLSGNYSGKINYPDASLTGDATLTITGNDFTLTSASETQTGRITAVTTCGYTAATMMFGNLTPPPPSPNPPAARPAISMRVLKVGDFVRLVTVPGEKRSFVFSSTESANRLLKRTQVRRPR